MPILSTTTNSITGIAVDWISGNVLYSDSIMGSIQQYHVTTGHVTPLVTNLRSPKVLATIPDEPYRLVYNLERMQPKINYILDSGIFLLYIAILGQLD